MLVFYNDQETLREHYGVYTGRERWDSPASTAGCPPVLAGVNTEDGIREALTSRATRASLIDLVYRHETEGKELTFPDAVGDRGVTIYVLKGLHQADDLHITVAFFGKIWHLNAQQLGSDQRKIAIKSYTAGEQLRDDPEWTVKR